MTDTPPREEPHNHRRAVPRDLVVVGVWVLEWVWLVGGRIV